MKNYRWERIEQSTIIMSVQSLYFILLLEVLLIESSAIGTDSSTEDYVLAIVVTNDKETILEFDFG